MEFLRDRGGRTQVPLKQYLSYLCPRGGSVRDGTMGGEATPTPHPEILAGAKGSRPRGTFSCLHLPPFLSSCILGQKYSSP